MVYIVQLLGNYNITIMEGEICTMKSFLEEYGLIIVAIIVIAALIALSLYFKTTASNKAVTQFDKFMEQAETAADTDSTIVVPGT